MKRVGLKCVGKQHLLRSREFMQVKKYQTYQWGMFFRLCTKRTYQCCIRICLMQKSIEKLHGLTETESKFQQKKTCFNQFIQAVLHVCIKESCQWKHVLNRWHSALKQRSACFWTLRGYQDPENRDHRRKCRSTIEPNRRCLVYARERNLVCSRHRQILRPVFTWFAATSRQPVMLML